MYFGHRGSAIPFSRAGSSEALHEAAAGRDVDFVDLSRLYVGS
jgi:hypothetical protein